MRACAVCFYFRENPEDRSEGACFNQPPRVLVVQTDEGQTILNVRPTVERDDFCCFFMHNQTDLSKLSKPRPR